MIVMGTKKAPAPVRNKLAILGGPPGLAIEILGNIINDSHDRKLNKKEAGQAKEREKANEKSRSSKIAKSNAKLTKKRKFISDNTPKAKQYGITKGSK